MWCTPASPLFPHCPLPCHACAFQLLRCLLHLFYRPQKAFVDGRKQLIGHTCLDHLHQLSLQLSRKKGAVPQKKGVSQESPRENAAAGVFKGSASLHEPKGAQNTGALMYARPCICQIGRGDHLASIAGNKKSSTVCVRRKCVSE